MKFIKEKKNLYIVLALLIIELVVGCYRNQHRIITDDEIFSVGLANNTGDFLFFENREVERFSNDAGWFSGTHYREYITVQPEERFSYKNVFINQGRDNHPPLFYLWVNTVSSFTPNENNYLGAAFINILSVCGVIWLLYLSMKKIAGDKWYTVIPSILWLCSMGCYQLTNYIRMYTLLCFWTFALIYIHICLIKEKEITIKRQVQLALVVCLGGLTHYYFYVFGFFTAATYLMLQLLQNRKELKAKYKILWNYVWPYLAGGLTAILIFPKVLKHIFKSSMSGRMQDNLKGNGLPFREAFDVINQDVFHGKMVWCVALIIIIVVSFAILYNRQKEHSEVEQTSWKEYFQIILILTVTIVGFLLIAMKASVYIAWYYLSPAYAVFILLVALIGILGYWADQPKITYAYYAIVCIYSIYVFTSGILPMAKQGRNEEMQYQAMVRTLTGSDCIYLSESWSCLYGNHLPDMAFMDEVCCITPDDYSQTELKDLLDGRETTEQELIMICRKVDEQEKYIQQMKEKTGLQGKLVWADKKNAFYRFQ